RVRTDLVAVPVIVTDSRRRRVSDLHPADFAVRDDRGALKIDYFASGTERVAMLFALDTSGSAREIIERQRAAALALFARFGHGSRIAVLHFGDLVRLTIPFTSNSEAALARSEERRVGKEWSLSWSARHVKEASSGEGHNV